MYNNLLRLAQEYQWYRNTNGTGVPMVILILYFNREYKVGKPVDNVVRQFKRR